MRRPFSYVAHHASRFLKHMLNTGFTTVRDVGGGDVGLAHALKDGLVSGSRLIYGGRLLSQTGGHADWRPGHEHDPTCIPCGCGMIDQRMSVLADGVDEVLKATREELRRGASHIKIVASGGVASPEDPVNALQYSPEEIAAIVGETRRHGSYVAAHCHPAGAIRACAQLGVRTIEHATLIDEETAKIVKQSGAYIVPTMAIIAGLAKDGAALGLPRASQLKLEEIAGHAQSAMAIAHAAGVPLGFGTDLLGPLYTRNLTEFDLRRDVFTPVEILRQATSVNAELMQMNGKIGCVAPGAFADLVAVDGNPLDDIGRDDRRPGRHALDCAGRGGRSEHPSRGWMTSERLLAGDAGPGFARAALLRLSAIEFWERYSYYNMFGLLALFFAAPLALGGMGWTKGDALRFFGWYLLVVSCTPMVGGLLIGRVISTTRALGGGATLMVAGHSLMAAPAIIPWAFQALGLCSIAAVRAAPLGGLVAPAGMPPNAELAYHLVTISLYTAIALIAVGNGLFKPVITVVIGRLPHANVVERDRAFTLFFLFINIGGLAALVVGGWLSEHLGWGWAFGAAGARHGDRARPHDGVRQALPGALRRARPGAGPAGRRGAAAIRMAATDRGADRSAHRTDYVFLSVVRLRRPVHLDDGGSESGRIHHPHAVVRRAQSRRHHGADAACHRGHRPGVFRPAQPDGPTPGRLFRDHGPGLRHPGRHSAAGRLARPAVRRARGHRPPRRQRTPDGSGDQFLADAVGAR